jgi:hypothetical protein
MQKLLDGALIIILATGFALNVKAARAERLTVTFGVPTVAGIRPAPVPGEFYSWRYRGAPEWLRPARLRSHQRPEGRARLLWGAIKVSTL